MRIALMRLATAQVSLANICRFSDNLCSFPKKTLLLPLLLTACGAFAQTTWDGSESTDWFAPNNWSAGVPEATDDVTIPDGMPNQPTIGAAGALVKSVIVQASAVLTIASAGELTIRDRFTYGVETHAMVNEGTVENYGQIWIVSTSNARRIGIRNRAVFHNKSTGTVNIEDCSWICFNNNIGTTTNEGIIRTGSSVSVCQLGISNDDIFNNLSSGEIHTDYCTEAGILSWIGTFTNTGQIHIGANGTVGPSGIRNQATFNNNATGEVYIDRSTSIGFYNQSGTTNNAGKITIGSIAGVGAEGIRNSATFNNSACLALIKVVSNHIIKNASGTFSNAGRIVENSTGTSNITNNSGTVQNLNGGTFTITTNTGLLTSTTSDIWTGCVSTDWATADNWFDGSVPNATDDVLIPNRSNDPVIMGGTGALAQSLVVQASVTFAIQAGGSLDINGSTGIALEQFGILNNSGTLRIGNTASVAGQGIVQHGSLNNKPGGLIQIDNTATCGICNEAGGNLTNEAAINIGGIANAGIVGLSNLGIFGNNMGGTLLIDNTDAYGLLNDNGGTFTNEANITIGSIDSVGRHGLVNANGATFNNNTGGAIAIDRSTDAGLSNVTGTFNNTGTIAIGAVASAGIYGLYNDGSFNNNMGASLSIDSSMTIGLFNFSGTFTNAANIAIGANTSVGNNGLVNNAIFNNNASGTISVDKTDGIGILNELTGTFNNQGTIVVGGNAQGGIIGVSNQSAATFNNNTGGTMAIDNSVAAALGNADGGSFSNASAIAIGGNAGVGDHGVYNQGAGSNFANNAGGTIAIDNSTGVALGNYEGGSFSNASAIAIGDNASTGLYGLVNQDANSTFNNDMGGQISIDNTTSSGIYNALGGTFTNAANINVGGTAGAGIAGLSNSAIFGNNMGGTISISNTDSYGLLNDNGGTFTNEADINIGATDSVGRFGLANSNGAAFNNNTGGMIAIGRSTDTGLSNANGTFNNAANITIGAVGSPGIYGLYNDGSFNNNTGASISIDSSTANGLFNYSGTFANTASIVIGANTSVGNNGLVNNAVFNNNASGAISVDGTDGIGILNEFTGSFNNQGSMVVGGEAEGGIIGVFNLSAGSFNNNTGGTMSIGHSTAVALGNADGGNFSNSSAIAIGGNAGAGLYGIVNWNTNSIFTNHAGGIISVDSASLAGILNDENGTVVNEGELNIGTNASVGAYGIQNFANFGNSACGEINMNEPLANGSSFTNTGLITINTGSAHTNNGTATNNGIIWYPQGNPVPNVVNSLGIGTASGGCSISPALDACTVETFSIATTWFLDENLTIFAGNYDEATNTFSNVNVPSGTPTTVYFEIEDAASGDKRVVSLIITSNCCNQTGTRTWTGATNNDWHTASNWNPSCIPTASDDVVIPNVVNDPTISTAAVAKSVTVQSEAVLTNAATGTLTIDGSTSIGILNQGTVENYGAITIGAITGIGSDGIHNQASFKNNACGTINMLAALNNSASFTNAGFFTLNTANAHTNSGTLTNNGTLEYPQGNPVPNVVNNEIIVKPVSGGCSLSPALSLGTPLDFNIGTTWYLQPNLTQPAGTYNPSNNTFTIGNLTEGTYPLYLAIADNANGCTRTISIVVNFDDATPPTTVCQNITVNLSGSSASITPSQVLNAAASSDNCGTVSAQSVSPNSFTCANTGQNIVTLVTNDGKGNTATCTAVVTVVDNTLPTAVCQNITVNLSGSSVSITPSQVLNAAASGDNCGMVSAQSVSPNSFTCANTGQNTVTLIANDGRGNTTTCTASVTVRDNTPPSIACPANIIRSNDANQCGAIVTYATPNASDNCAVPTLQHNGWPSGANFPVGTTIVIWTASDGTLMATCSFNVTVNDTQVPSITCPSNQSLPTTNGFCNALATYAPVASDNCSTSPILHHSYSGATVKAWASGEGSGNAFNKGISTVTLRATDAAGLTKTCTFRIIVSDLEAPTMACPSSINVNATAGQCGAVVTYNAPTYTDNCAPSSGTAVRVAGPASGSTFPTGITNVVFRATDAANNARQCTMTVTVSDNLPPSITCPQNIVQNNTPGACNTPVVYSTPTATDNCGVNAVFLSSGLASGSVFPVGTTAVTWQANDVNGLSATCSFSVMVACGAARPNPLADRTPNEAAPVGGSAVQGYTLSPNPATDAVNIAWKEPTPVQVAIFNAQGRLVWAQNTSGEAQMLQVAVSDWNAGVYWVSLRAKEVVVTKRLVVER